jgi:hypothetical protein
VAHSSRLEEAEAKFEGPVSRALRATGKASAILVLKFGNQTETWACLERLQCGVCASWRLMTLPELLENSAICWRVCSLPTVDRFHVKVHTLE